MQKSERMGREAAQVRNEPVVVFALWDSSAGVRGSEWETDCVSAAVRCMYDSRFGESRLKEARVQFGAIGTGAAGGA